jgi:hypothetical protein
MAFSGALVKKGSDQTTANFTAAFTALTWDTETFDVGGWHDTGSNTSRLTVPSGVTHVKLTGAVGISAITGATSSIYLAVFKNGDTNVATRLINMPLVGPLVMSGGDYQLSLASGPLAVTPGDYFELVILITSDTSVTVTAAQSFFAIEAVENFSGAMAKKSADQTAADYSAGPVITWNTDALDVGGWHDTGSNTSRLTVPSGVNYVRVYANVNVVSISANNDTYAWIEKNGDNNAATRHVNLPVGLVNTEGGSEAYINLVSPPLAVVAGDYFEVRLLIQGDASVTVEDFSWFAIEKLA